MGKGKKFGAIVGGIAGNFVSLPVLLAASVTESDFLYEMHEGIVKVSMNTGALLGDVTEGTVETVKGVVNEDKKLQKQGINRVLDSGTTYVEGLGKGIIKIAKDGIDKNSGLSTIDNRNKRPVTIAVKPVLPPAATPEALSTNVVTVDVPSTAPEVVATASAIKAPLIFGSFPSLSSISALDATPMRVPNVSKISTKRNANITTIKLIQSTLAKSALNTCPKVKPKELKSKLTIAEGIVLYIPASGLGTYIPTNSAIIPRIHVAKIPKRIPPFTFFTRRRSLSLDPLFFFSLKILGLKAQVLRRY